MIEKALYAENNTVRKIAVVIKKVPIVVYDVKFRIINYERFKKLVRPSKIMKKFLRAVFRSVVRAPNELIASSKLVKMDRSTVGVTKVEQIMQ